MNRRRFILTGTAGLTLLGNRAAAQRAAPAGTVIVSELTNAEIDFTESGFSLLEQELRTDPYGDGTNDQYEHIHFTAEKGELEIDLIPTGSGDWERAMLEFTASFSMLLAVEEYAFATLADGGYSAFSFDTTAIYFEHQVGAFPDYDMRVYFTSETTSFQNEFALAQTIMVGGAAPCLFTAESKVEEIVFAGAAQTTTTGSRSGRVTNTTQPTGSTTSNTSQTASRPKINTNQTSGTANTGASSDTTGSESDYVAAVIAHREDFLTSYGLFTNHLAVVGETTTTDVEKADLFTQMYDIAVVWKSYPDDAMATEPPASLTELSTLYVEWASVIGEMGTLFEELYNGADTVDAFIATVSDFELLDAELQVQLEAYGYQGYTGASGALASIRSGLKATCRSVH